MSTTLNASSRIMYEEALKLGITCTLFSDQETILMEKDGQRWYTRGSRTSLQSSIGRSFADNKHLTKMILEHYHLPTAKAIKVSSSEDLTGLDELRYPVVMKPLDGKHGAGVVVGIPDRPAAMKAYAEAHTQVLFEEMLEGLEYRIVCVDFKFVAAAFRKPAFVTGDGKQTILELVAQKNQHPWRGEGHISNLTLIKIDASVENTLLEQGLTPDSVPAVNQEVPLRLTANLSTGGEAWNVSHEVCPENKALFEKISQACDLNVIGIDIMCPSLAEPILETASAGVIEVNASPGLRMHHYPIQGEAVNVAQKILEMVLAKTKHV